MDIHPPVKQRPLLLKMAAQLEISLGQLRRDDCGDWAIHGRFGTVASIPTGFSIVIGGWLPDAAPWSTSRGWNICKKEMSFCELTQDADDEGVFRLDRLPTSEESEKIRRYAGLRRRKNLSPEAVEKLRDNMRAVRRDQS